MNRAIRFVVIGGLSFLVLFVAVLFLVNYLCFSPKTRLSDVKSLSRPSIPKVLYKTGREESMPPSIKALTQSFMKANPGWNVQYYGNRACLAFLKKYFAPEVADAWTTLKPGAFKADLWRLCVLYARGGVYSDFSQQILVPIESLVDVERDELVLVGDNYHSVFFLKPFGIHNAFMAAVPQHPWLKQCIDAIVTKVQNRDYGRDFLNITGPTLLGDELTRTPNLNYRMELVYCPDLYLRYLKGGRIAIRHKLPDHYKLLGTGKKGFIDAWYRKQVYNT